MRGEGRRKRRTMLDKSEQGEKEVRKKRRKEDKYYTGAKMRMEIKGEEEKDKYYMGEEGKDKQ